MSCYSRPNDLYQLVDDRDAGELVTLWAEGCTNATWSWSNSQEYKADQLVLGANQLTVNPEYSTTYRVRCHTDGCLGRASNALNVEVQPVLTLKQLNKHVLCPSETMLATYKLRGKPTSEIAYGITIRNNEHSLTLTAINRDSTLMVNLPVTIPSGSYWVNSASTLRGMKAVDSIQIMIRPLPTAELSTDKLIIVPGDSIRVSVALTGMAHWQFKNWNEQFIKTQTSPYVSTLKANQSPTYKLTIAALSDANCSTGLVRNELTINALILATEPAATGGFFSIPISYGSANHRWKGGNDWNCIVEADRRARQGTKLQATSRSVA